MSYDDIITLRLIFWMCYFAHMQNLNSLSLLV